MKEIVTTRELQAAGLFVTLGELRELVERTSDLGDDATVRGISVVEKTGSMRGLRVVERHEVDDDA